MAGSIIAALILIYSAFVICRKIRQFRRGQFCDCGCFGNCKKCSQK